MLRVDSRKIQKGDTFLALRGVNTDGHDYIEKAIQNGASKVIAESGSYSVETILVKDTRKYLSEYLKEQFKEMRKQMTLIGITGTNGKTTTAFFVHSAFHHLKIKAAYIGTVGFYIKDKVRSLNNTTPDLYDLYELFREAYEKGCKVIVMEVSSQGISYGRVMGIDFDMALFTNLTQDHLDYHKTMKNYSLAKKQLFCQLNENGVAIVNNDDSYKNTYLLKENRNVTYGFTPSTYQVIEDHMSIKGTNFTVRYENKDYMIQSRLLGKYNVYNALSCISILHEYGISMDQIVSIFPMLQAPVGRMEMIPFHENTILIDYAHTPDAMENILKTVMELHPKHLYAVFGCTGDRDRGKRPIMTDLILKNCDYAVLTNDDPHNEDPNQIIKDMLEHNSYKNYDVILDRREAIKRGISFLKETDMLLILGKGHEEFMIVKEEKIPFNDRKVVESFIKEYQKN